MTASGRGAEIMYAFLEKLEPWHVHAIASRLYVEMLKAGYTSVGEFHYLHHQADGTPYADPCELAYRVIDAANRTGIAMTLLPVLYCHGGFGGEPPRRQQQRFVLSQDGFVDMFEKLFRRSASEQSLQIGIAPHSLRAVTKDELQVVLSAVDSIANDCPVHIHIAEQAAEVAQCMNWSGARPVEWLYDNLPVDERWCLIHATHVTGNEVRKILRSGAVVGLCPSTEANLGDGLFPFASWFRSGGRFGIGSDSNVSISPREELRWLEYGQRLRRKRRNIAASPNRNHTGSNLWHSSLEGGAQALAQPVHGLEVGQRADLVLLDCEHPILTGRREETLLDSFLFSGNENIIRDVFVGGDHVVENGRHVREEEINGDWNRAILSLTA